MSGQHWFYHWSITVYTGLSLVILLYDFIICWYTLIILETHFRWPISFLYFSIKIIISNYYWPCYNNKSTLQFSSIFISPFNPNLVYLWTKSCWWSADLCGQISHDFCFEVQACMLWAKAFPPNSDIATKVICSVGRDSNL